MCLGKLEPGGPARCTADAYDRAADATGKLDAALVDSQAAKDAMNDAVLTTVLATPWRPESGDLFDTTGFEHPHEAQEFMEWRDTVLDTAERHGVRIVESEDVQGMWRGEGEPSVRMEVEGSPEDIKKWADVICSRYEQDSVLVAIPVPDGTEGSTDSISIPPDPTVAPLLEAAGIEGYTVRGDSIELIAPSQDTADALEDMGIPTKRHAVMADFRDPSEEERSAAAAGGPNKNMQALRSQYMTSNKLKHEELPVITDEQNMRDADIYYELPDARYDSEVKNSYRAFNDHLAQQYDFLVSEGYTLEPQNDTEAPYGNLSSKMMKDVRDNKHLYYYPSVGDGADLGEDHPMAQMIDVSDGRGGTEKVMANDVFRAVHDAFAHCDGHSFGPRGEKRAWWAHRVTLPKEAHLALWNETRAQNVWTNFGPHMRNEDGSLKKGDELGKYKANSERPFAVQRVVKPDSGTLI